MGGISEEGRPAWGFGAGVSQEGNQRKNLPGMVGLQNLSGLKRSSKDGRLLSSNITDQNGMKMS